MKSKIFILIILFNISLTGLFCMGIASSYEIISWSEDGSGLVYYILGGDNYTNESFELFNYLSPGDGSTPERINIIHIIIL